MNQQRPAGVARRLWPALAIATASSGVLIALDHPAQSGSVGGSAGAASSSTATLRPQQPPVDQQTGPASTSAAAANRPTAAPRATSAPKATSAQAGSGGGGTGGGTCTGTVKTGAEEDTRFGIVQVQATVSPTGQICTVDAIQTPNDRRRSISINQQAVPILDNRALAAQGTAFQTVSGATVTTSGYKASLQSILDGN